jgi:hypothetical protein
MKTWLVIGAAIALSGCVSGGDAARIAACGAYSADLSAVNSRIATGALSADEAQVEIDRLKNARVECLGEVK